MRLGREREREREEQIRWIREGDPVLLEVRLVAG
jgi:translation initiation factor IF-1